MKSYRAGAGEGGEHLTGAQPRPPHTAGQRTRGLLRAGPQCGAAASSQAAGAAEGHTRGTALASPEAL